MAKKLSLTVDHALGVEEALLRMKALGEYYQNRHDGSAHWENETGQLTIKYLFLSIDAVVTVHGDRVVLEGPDPGMLLRNKARAYLAEKITSYLDPGTPPDQLPRS